MYTKSRIFNRIWRIFFKKLKDQIWRFQPILYHGNTTTSKTKAPDTFLRFKPEGEPSCCTLKPCVDSRQDWCHSNGSCDILYWQPARFVGSHSSMWWLLPEYRRTLPVGARPRGVLESVLGLRLTSHVCQHVRAARRRVAEVQKQLQSPCIVFEKKSSIFCYDSCT